MDYTTLSIQKSIHRKASKAAKKQHLSVSAVVRMLLEAYAEGKIKIGAIPSYSERVEFDALPAIDMTSKIKEAIRSSKKLPKSAFKDLS